MAQRKKTTKPAAKSTGATTKVKPTTKAKSKTAAVSKAAAPGTTTKSFTATVPSKGVFDPNVLNPNYMGGNTIITNAIRDNGAIKLAEGLKDMQLQIRGSLTIKPEVEIVKPEGNQKQIEIGPDTNSTAALCEINNIPSRRNELIRVYNKLDVNITNAAFYGDKVLDDSRRSDLRGVDFTHALKEYAVKYGEQRYFYSRFVSNIGGMFNSDENAWSEDITEALINQGMSFLMYHSGEFLIAQNSATPFEKFREKILGWRNTNIGDKNEGSIYAPEEVDNILRSSGDVINTISGGLKLMLYVKRSQAMTLKNELQAAFEDSGLGDPLNAARQSTLAYLLLKLKDRATVDERTHVMYYKYKRYGTNGGYIGETIHRITKAQFMGYDEIDRIVTAEDIKDDFEMVMQKLQYLEEQFKMYEGAVGEAWNHRAVMVYNAAGLGFYVTHYKVYANLIVLIQRAQTYLNGLVDEASAPLVAQHNQDMERVNKLLDAYNLGSGLIDNGVVIEGIVNRVSEVLRSGVTVRKLVLDEFSPMLLSVDTGAYQELPAQQYKFVPLPENRLHNLLNYVPEVGLISEYAMEIKHQRFGYGKHIYSQSLFPGEEVTIEMSTKSKKQVEVTTNSSEKIFEEAGSETSTDFGQELNNEFSRSTDSSKKSAFSASATLSASGFGASVSGSISKSSESSHAVNEVSKNVSNTTDKLAKKLSDQRQVTFESSSSEKITTSLEEEQKTTRKFVNINKERTLTFNFFQVTREYQNTLFLEDILFYYTSGKYRVGTIFIHADVANLDLAYIRSQAATNAGYQKLVEIVDAFDAQGLTWQALLDQRIIRRIPGEVSDYFSPDAVVMVYEAPYYEMMPLAVTNMFLATHFDMERVTLRDINNLIWKYIGGGSISPEGLGIAAFPAPKGELANWPAAEGAPAKEANVFNASKPVVADRLKIRGVAGNNYEYILPNIDLCYKKVRHFRNRYVATEPRPCMPLPIMQKTYVINTEGVYCENMLGNCGALESFATDHRRLDVEAKELANKQAKLLLPPDIAAYTVNGEVDFVKYGQAVEQYEKMVKANKIEQATDTSATV